MGHIYKIENQINGMVYIGKSIDYKLRWKCHMQTAKREGKQSQGPLYRAMREYGIDNFSFSLIEECKDSDLDEREEFWIAEYCATDKTKGYNLSKGGVADRRCVCQYNKNGEHIATYKSLRIAASKTGLSQNSIKNACDGATCKCGGFLWRYEGNPAPRADHIKSHGRYTAVSRPVEQYDLFGRYIRSFRSLNNAHKETGIQTRFISQCCNGTLESISGYKWRFADRKDHMA